MKLGTLVSQVRIDEEDALAAESLGRSGIKDTENAFQQYRSNLE